MKNEEKKKTEEAKEGGKGKSDFLCGDQTVMAIELSCGSSNRLSHEAYVLFNCGL